MDWEVCVGVGVVLGGVGVVWGEDLVVTWSFNGNLKGLVARNK